MRNSEESTDTRLPFTKCITFSNWENISGKERKRTERTSIRILVSSVIIITVSFLSVESSSTEWKERNRKKERFCFPSRNRGNDRRKEEKDSKFQDSKRVVREKEKKRNPIANTESD